MMIAFEPNSEADRAAFHPLPRTAPFCRVLPGFLSPDECRTLVAQAQQRGFSSAASDYPPSYRTNDRQVLDDDLLAGRLLRRLRGDVPATIPAEDAGAPWTLDAINARFRLCRYTPGQSFGLHQDGMHHRGPHHRSQLTFMVYLTDAVHFEGGDTVFYESGPDAPPVEIGRVRPRAGSLIVFDHALWHAGAVVHAGVKHVLRSDVLYRRAAPEEAPQDDFDVAHRGYIWTLELVGPHLFASGGRDGSIHVWDSAGHRASTLAGHRRSVLGLALLASGRLASVSRDRSLRVWDLAAARCLRVVDNAHVGAILSVLALPDGALATAGADGIVRIWSADGVPRGALEATPAWIWSLANLPGGRIGGASEDGAIRIWDRRDGRVVEVIAGDAPLRSVAVTADGRILLSGDVAGRVIRRESVGGEWRAAQVLQVHAAAVRRVRTVGADSVASVGEDGTVRVSSLHGERSHAVVAHANFATDVVQVDGALFSCGYDGRIRRLQALDLAERTHD